MRPRATLVGLLLAVPVAGCGLLLGLSTPDYADADAAASADAQPGEGGAPKASSTADGGGGPGACGDGRKAPQEACDGVDVGDASCSAAVAAGWVGTLGCAADCTLVTSACETPATTYNDIRDPSFWSVVRPSTLGLVINGGYFGGVFDGKYVYFPPASGGPVFRHDTSRELGDVAAWSSFQTAALGTNSSTYSGGAFDGRYVYFVPRFSAFIVRYDTTADFGSLSSWSRFDVSKVNALAAQFYGAVFDGRYLTFAPSGNFASGSGNGIVVRYDTQGDFQAASSWDTFDLKSKPGLPTQFLGGAFDGQYVYLLPEAGRSSSIARHDTRLGFTAPDSWTSYDVASVPGSHPDATGGAFDGRFLHVTPQTSSVLTRYDTTGALDGGAAWGTFDVSTIVDQESPKGFAGAAFDGRRVVLSPSTSTVAGLVDTTQPFGTDAYFTSYDLASVLGLTADAGPRFDGFGAAVFDGIHVYFLPGSTNVVARFETKSPGWLPRRWNASFL